MYRGHPLCPGEQDGQVPDVDRVPGRQGQDGEEEPGPGGRQMSRRAGPGARQRHHAEGEKVEDHVGDVDAEGTDSGRGLEAGHGIGWDGVGHGDGTGRY